MPLVGYVCPIRVCRRAAGDNLRFCAAASRRGVPCIVAGQTHPERTRLRAPASPLGDAPFLVPAADARAHDRRPGRDGPAGRPRRRTGTRRATGRHHHHRDDHPGRHDAQPLPARLADRPSTRCITASALSGSRSGRREKPAGRSWFRTLGVREVDQAEGGQRAGHPPVPGGQSPALRCGGRHGVGGRGPGRWTPGPRRRRRRQSPRPVRPPPRGRPAPRSGRNGSTG